jgi:rod shape-determining protein MreC
LKKFFHENGIWVLIAALLLTSVITLGSSLMPSLTSPLTNVIGVVSSPFQRVASSFTGWVEGMYNYAFRYDQLESELEKYKQLYSDMRSEIRKAQDAQEENDALREALGLSQSNPDFTLLDVTVTEGSSNSLESVLTLSKGSNAGIEVNDCVITGTGYLVGVVKEVGTNWSKIITLVDPNIEVSAVVYRTGDQTMLESDLELMREGKCKLTFLGAESTFISGDEVLTSGAGGVYPSGLVIGNVDLVEPAASGLEQYAIVTPSADLNNLGTIFVITAFDEQ